MASESESEEFFDAEEKPLGSNKSKQHLRLQAANLSSTEASNKAQVLWEHHPQSPTPSPEEIKEAERKAKESEQRRKKVEELRRKMLTEDEEELPEPSSGQSSKASSVDGIFLNKFERRIFQEDASKSEVNSIISLGKVGSLLGDKDSVSLDSRDNSHDGLTSSSGRRNQEVISLTGGITLAEPDLVASTKGGGDRGIHVPPIGISSGTESAPMAVAPSPSATVTPIPPAATVAPPVAPPRRKRKTQKQHSLDSTRRLPEPITIQGLPSPTSTIGSFSHEMEFSLDLRSATRGQYVVKPQDHERDRAPPAERNVDEIVSELKSELLQEAASILAGGGSRGGSMENEINNFMMRTRSDSGRPLTDIEILEQVMVLNLDTGEKIPLSLAEDRLPRGINPLSLHIMRLTSEYVSNSSLEKDKESDEESVIGIAKSSSTLDAGSVRKKTARFKKMIGRTVERTVNKIKNVKDEVYHARHAEELDSSEDDTPLDSKPALKIKAAHGHKGPYEFDSVRELQDLANEHVGAVWTMKFSCCGRLLATAGQDHILRIWVLRDSFTYFDDMRQKYNAEVKVSPTPSQESLVSQISMEDPTKNSAHPSENAEDQKGPFMSKPFCTYHGHTADLLDVAWSKNYFILSSSMDKTVRLWHISRKECLCCFQHIDFVTAIAFHPRDDRYFLSGSLDGKLRLWNIPDKKVALWNELDGQAKLITAACFCQNGKFAVVGSYDGRCIFYNTEQLKYYTQINVRSTRGKNKQGRKITGIEPMPGEDKILVTSNDSRIRMYDLRDLSLSCKYKGYVNLSSQIKASFSHDGKYIISGSENQFIYLWKTNYDYSKFSSARRDRNDYWEGIKAHNALVTAAVFAPYPSLILSQLDQQTDSMGHQQNAPNSNSSTSNSNNGYVFVTADFSGTIKVFAKKSRGGKAATLPSGIP